MNTEITNKIDALFEELVPLSGKAENRAGEMIRAISRIGHRFYNDGDMIGIDYGKETCNPAARYLMKYGDEAVDAAFDDLHGWWMKETEYEAFLDKLAAAVLNQVESHPELRNSSRYMRDFLGAYPPTFQISAKCCDYCKKQTAHRVQKGYEMVITGERRDEGGMRSVPRKDNTALCFGQTASGQYRLRPLYYVSDKDKAWYKAAYKIRYSDAYEVYGLTRTGCCGCPISYKAVEDLKLIEPYEPNVVKAAWAIFGDSYRYRQQYNAYKKQRDDEKKKQYPLF